jgi:hypothetical protein
MRNPERSDYVDTEPLDFSAQVRAVADRVDALGSAVALGSDPLGDLRALDRMVSTLTGVRDAVLKINRDNGTSWNALANRTQVPASTWRTRSARRKETTGS